MSWLKRECKLLVDELEIDVKWFVGHKLFFERADSGMGHSLQGRHI